MESVQGSSGLLRSAAEHGKTACVETLLQLQVDLSLPDNVGATALMLAAKTGRLDIVKMLLASGADVNLKDNEGRRAVAYASRNGHKDVVKALVLHQAASTSTPPTAHVGQVSVQRASSMDGAAGGAPDDLAPRELDGALAMLVEAADAGDEAKVDEVLRSWPELDVNALHEGETALMQAVGARHVGVVRKLLAEYHADPNVLSTEGKRYTCLMLAAGKDDELVRLLLEHGANVHAKDAYGCTAVIHAVTSEDAVAVRSLDVLKAHGADLMTTCRVGVTALMVAAYKGKIELIRYLLANGADPTARNGHGRDAIACAKEGPEGSEAVAVLTEAVKAHVERLAAQLEGPVKGEAPMQEAKKHRKKHRKKGAKGEGGTVVCEGNAEAGGGVGGTDVNVDAAADSVDGVADGDEEQQLEHATELMAVASLHEGQEDLATEEVEAQGSATAVVPPDGDGVKPDAAPIELTEEDFDDAPTLFECPISHAIMRDPVAACDGYSYERAHIETWIRKAAEDDVALRSPMTNEPMEAGLTRNLVLKCLIDEYLQRKLTEKKARLAAAAAKGKK